MKASFKCENCLKETPISGEGPRHLGCQSCGCGDIKFDVDVILAPISDKNPGDPSTAILVKKDENFLASHSQGNSWRLSFPAPETAIPPSEPLKLRKKVVKGNAGFYSKL